MPDLLTHVLLVFALGTVLRWRWAAFQSHYIPVVMIGAVLPDLAKIQLVLSADTMRSLLGSPFSWEVLHRAGGTLVLIAIGVLLFDRSHRRTAALLLGGGAVTQFLLDGLLKRANGVVSPYFYPFSWWQPPTGNLFLSSDVWPAMVAIAVVSIIWVIDRRRGSVSD